MKKNTPTTSRPQQRWTPALRFVLAIAQILSVIGVSTINLTQPKFAPLVGDALGPWAVPLAEAVDAAIGQPNVAAAAVIGLTKTGPVTATAGSTITYTIRITNNAVAVGPPGIAVADILTPALAFGSVFSNGVLLSGGTGFPKTIRLFPNQSVTLTVGTVPGITGMGLMTNTAFVGGFNSTVTTSVYASCAIPYAVDFEFLTGSPTGRVYAINLPGATLSTLPAQFRLPVPLNVDTAAMAVTPDGSRFFYLGPNGSATPQLYYQDTIGTLINTGLVFTSPTSIAVAMGIGPTGIGYVLDNPSAPRLWQFSTSGTITRTLLGALTDTPGNAFSIITGPSNISDITFGADGYLYTIIDTFDLVNNFYNHKLFRIDPNTLIATYLGEVGSHEDTNYGGLALLSNGDLLASDTNLRHLIQINLATLNFTILNTTPGVLGDLASCIFPVLVPSVGISKTNTPVSNVMPGTRITYTMVISNDGTLLDSGVTFSDSIPANTTFVAGSLLVRGGSGAVVNNTVTQVGNLISGLVASPGQLAGVLLAGSFPANTVVITYAVTVNAGVITGTNLVNTAQITTSQVPSPSVSTVTNTVQVPVLIATKVAASVLGSVTRPGDTVGFTAPEGYTFTLPTVGDTAHDSNVNLGTGTTVPVTLASGEFNSSIDAGLWLPLPNLTLVKKAHLGRGTVRSGELITYTLVVRNDGPGIATDVVISDPLASTLEYVTGSAVPAAQVTGQTVVWTKPSLGVGEEYTFTLVARVLPSNLVTSTQITNIGYAFAIGPDNKLVNLPNTRLEDAGQSSVPIEPTAVVLTLFRSTWLDDGAGVHVVWETGSEINTLGFGLYRSADGTRASAVLVTPELIASRSNNNGGASYSFDDATAQSGTTYTYWLQEQETTGALNEYGPVDTNGRQIVQPRVMHLYLPALMR